MSVLAIGQRVRREEDFRLLTGRGRYVEDVAGDRRRPRGYVVRSPHAHARIVSIDAERARAAPGVLAVLTGAELERRGLGTLRPLIPRRKRNGAPAYVCPQPLLAQERVRYVGQPVAFIVAETLEPGEGRGGTARDRVRAAAARSFRPRRRSRPPRPRCGTTIPATRPSRSRPATRRRSTRRSRARRASCATKSWSTG